MIFELANKSAKIGQKSAATKVLVSDFVFFGTRSTRKIGDFLLFDRDI